MRYVIDHDFHIHSGLSLCSKNPLQNRDTILKYAEENGLKTIVITDHFWDEDVVIEEPELLSFYKRQGYDHIKEILPLPQGKNTKFLFGAETDMTYKYTIGVGERVLSELDFIIIPTTHMHMTGFAISEEDAVSPERRAKVWINKLGALLSAKLPFRKIGLAHLACPLIAPTREEYLELLRLLPENELRRLFRRAAELGMGIELNQSDFSYKDEEADTVLRPFLIAKSEGCKFYLGSDAHHPEGFEKTISVFNKAVDALSLKESDKFILS